MTLRREGWFAIGGLIALNVLLAFGMIGLFMRMGPTIERILKNNVSSIIAGQRILAEIALSDNEGGVTSLERVRILKALQQVKDNVTEPAEVPIVFAIERAVNSLFSRDPSAKVEIVKQVKKIVSINRLAMENVDEEARRLGNAGAWAAVFIGFLSFAMSLFIVGRLQQRVLIPLDELRDVLDACKQGDRFRRCRERREAPAELKQVLHAINSLLDERSGHFSDANRISRKTDIDLARL